MNKPISALYAFLNAAGGNWRNAAWIECDFCPYGRKVCAEHLMTMDRDGHPFVFSVDRFREFTEEIPQKDECAAVLNRVAFETLYSGWLLWKIDDPCECRLLQLEMKK